MLSFVDVVLRPVPGVDHLLVFEEVVSLELEKQVPDSEIWLVDPSFPASFVLESHVWLVFSFDPAVSQPDVESQFGS